MSSLKFIDANLISVFAAILFKKCGDGYQVKLNHIRAEIRDIFKRNHFIPPNNDEIFNPQETVMEFKIFYPYSEIEFIKYINEQLLDKSQFPKMSDRYKKIQESIDDEKCIELYFYNNMSYEEIAKITNIPLNTVKTYIFRAKKELYQKLKEII